MAPRTNTQRAAVVVDLGFGDSGKGLVTDALVRELGAHVVVRFNGGGQAGHNVVTGDGRHHTFSQLGAGSFVPGVRTFLSRHVVVHPTALLVEARILSGKGVPLPLTRLLASREALVTTPYHQAANRIRELARGEGRHGSCGVGVGETVADALASPEEAIRLGDLLDRSTLRAKLGRLRERKREALAAELRATARLGAAEPEHRVFDLPELVDRYLEAIEPFVESGAIVGDEVLAELLATGDVVFEGAQGVLLDEHAGFHPHTTWSRCTFANALELLRDADFDGETMRVGVLRTYATRHGRGPMPTEDASLAPLLPEPHNTHGPWQEAFRVGPFDAVLARYALEVVGGVDGLAFTHLDALGRLVPYRVCTGYRSEAPVDPRLARTEARDASRIIGLVPPVATDLEHAQALARLLERVQPEYELLLGPADNARARGTLLEWIESLLETRIRMTSSGPTAGHVVRR